MDVNGDLMNGTRYEQMDSLPIIKPWGFLRTSLID